VTTDSDILARLRNWRSVHLARLHEVMGEAADEIERLRGDADVARLRLKAAHAEIARLHDRLSLWEWCAEKTREMYGGCFRPEYAAKVREVARGVAGTESAPHGPLERMK
jgi:hypothetical protein